MEYVEGGELWGFLHEVAGKSTGENNAQVSAVIQQMVGFILGNVISSILYPNHTINPT